jgi:hypothetical protein
MLHLHTVVRHFVQIVPTNEDEGWLSYVRQELCRRESQEKNVILKWKILGFAEKVDDELFTV